MEWFKKIKNKLGVVALFALMFQLTMPIYQNYVYAQEDGIEESSERDIDTLGEDETEADDGELDDDPQQEINEENEAEEDTEEDIDSEDEPGIEEETSEETEIEVEETKPEEEEADEADEAEGDLPSKSIEELDFNNEDSINKSIEKNDIRDSEEKHGFTLKLNKATDLQGKPFDDDHQLALEDEFYLDLEWELEDGHNHVEGDTQEFQLPHGIKIQEEFEIELDDEFGQKIAVATVKTDGTVKLTFTGFVEGHSAISGHMQIVSMIDEDNVDVEDGEIVLKPIGDEGEIRIPIDLRDREKTIEKNGTPNKGYNADEINWEVTINKMKNNLKNATVTDVLPEGTEFKDGSLKVTKLDVDLNGNIKGDLEVIDITGDSVEEGILNIPLGDIKDAYRIEYVTKVTDDEQKTFINDVTLSDEDLEDVSANKTITINRGDPIKKSAVTAYNPKTGIIEWEIEFNFNQKDLENITLKDAWTPKGKMHLVEESLKFQEVTIDENGDTHNEGEAIHLPEGAELVNGEDQFEVTGITTDKAYKITYQTKINDRVLDGFDITNTAGFGKESNDSGTGVGTYYGSKSAGNVDYKNKTIDWTIEINHDEYPMEKISILDTLGDGLTLDKDTIEITVDGKPYEGKYTVSDSNPFELKFPEEFTTDKKIVIKYKTKFVADEVKGINTEGNEIKYLATNNASITWTPEGGSNSITKEVKANKKLNKRTEDNSWKEGSYNPETKEITWTIYTNYRENQIDNLIVKDVPQGNQKIIKGSAVVKELEIESNGNFEEGSILEDVSTIDIKNNTLDVNIGKTNKAYKIEYKTSLEGLSDIQKEYVNKAEVFDGSDSLSKIDAKVGIAEAHTYAAKSGKQDGKQIHWAVTVNPGQQMVTNLKLEDTVSENQDILNDTFKVYEANVDKNGNATKKGDPISLDQYELIHEEGEPTFTVKWKETVERAFIVEYSTLFFAGHKENVTNNYNVTGDNIVEDGKTDGSGSVTIKQFGSGGGVGTAGYLVIDKKDATYGQEETQLAGAEFDLIDFDTGKVLKSATTNEEGTIDFGRLLFGKYELHERVVPDGYVTKKEKQTIEINEVYDSEKDKSDYAYEVVNYVPVFAVELLKTGKDNEALKGAEFSLFDLADTKLQTKTTDKDGKILFEEIENAGEYYIQETKAPAGYVLDDTKHNVIIDEKQHEPVKVSAVNKERGAVQLTKTDVDTEEALAGVKFVLQKENNTGGYDTVSTHATDDKGQFTTSNTLEAGNYQFVEEEALDGYRTNGKPIKFTVNVNSTEMQEFTMTNEQHKGLIKLIKKDAVTDESLKGAEFKLVGASGETIESGLTTNNKGEIYVGEFFLGNYQLIETKAPTGYERDETPIDIEITEDEQVVEKTMTNNQLTDISVKKEWNSGGEKTESVTVKLLPTGEEVELSDGNDWTAKFTDLRVYDSAGNKIDYKVVEQTVDGYKTTITGDKNSGYIITNTKLMNISGTKEWMDDNDPQRPDSITVQLIADGDVVPGRTADANKKNDWVYTFEDLPVYDADGKEITYDIEELAIDGYQVEKDGFNLTNTRANTISVTGEKSWKDEDSRDRPSEITVNLTREVDGEEDKDFNESKTVKPNAQGNWIYEFEDLDEFDEDGVEYTYIVKELDVPDNYVSSVENHNITNTRIGTTFVSGTKRWKDDKVDDRPEFIEVDLLRNDVPFQTKKVKAANNWKYTFDKLDKYDEDGKYYKYEVKERQVLGYKPEVDGNDITNTRSEKTSIKITKGWLDDDSEERPDSVIVYVNRGIDADELERLNTVEVKSVEDWALTIDNLEAYNEDGLPYIYELEEKEIDGYESTVNGFNITNLRVGKTEVIGEKKWDEVDKQYRPDSVTVNLLANGEPKDSVKISEGKNWKYAFEDLDKYDDEGKEIEYTVEEDEVPAGYTSTVIGSDITNKQIETEVAGEKIWLDDLDEHPEITINLLANGEKTDKSLEVSAATNWEYRFTEIPKYDKTGDEIEYTVEEETIDGYATTIEDFVVTNLRVGETEVTGEKKWKDAGPEDRPDSIEVILTRNVKGELDTDFEKQMTVTPDSEGNWNYTFKDLPEFNDKGIVYTYTVKEETEPTGYEASVDGYDITNLRVGTVDLSGTKTWKDDNIDDRPDSITVNLLQNNSFIKTKEVTEADDWSYTFEDLAEFDEEGIAYDYRVSEEEVPGYAAEVEGMNITNTRSDKKNIEITKGWLDDDSKDRPKSIKVDLYQNDELYETVKVKASNDWVYEFKDLEAYDENGEAYTYSVEEQTIKGYESKVNGFNITNTRVGSLSIEGEKIWKDEGPTDRPDSIEVTLTRELKGVADEEFMMTETVTPDSSGKWMYVFDDLPEFDEQGVAYDYQVKEDGVPAGYKSSIDGYDITNLRVGTTEVSILKKWANDNKDNRPMSIEVDLLQNGKVLKTVTLSEADGWKYTFTDLPAFDKEGKAYTYTIFEKPIEGYETSVEETDEGFEITNTYVVQEKPIEPGKPSEPDKPEESDLPKTGETSTFAFYLIGGLLIAAGLVVGKRRTE